MEFEDSQVGITQQGKQVLHNVQVLQIP